MQKYTKRAAQLISNLCITNSKRPEVISPVHTKDRVSAPELRFFKRVKPSAKGVDARVLSSLIEALEAEPRACVQSIMVIKDGACVLEASAPGCDTNTFRLSHSMTKTVTGLAIGILADEYGLDLSRRVIDIFPEYEYSDKRFPEMTVEHLLTMRSGVPFSELGTVTESEWTATFIGSDLSFAPGEKFHYNSMNSYMLARIIERISGEGAAEFIEKRLFAPLGITNYLWELSPEGVAKGGFGLYLSTESWAKIGLLFLGVGAFRSRQIISRSWILRMITERSVAPESTGAFNYGYHVWVARSGSDFLLNGMLGQNVWICPENNLVAVINCSNNELFQESAALSIVRGALRGNICGRCSSKDMAYFKQRAAGFFEARSRVHGKKPLRGLAYALRLRSAVPFDTAWQPLLGEYAFPDNNAGLLPVFVSVMQNNFGGGIEKISLRREGDSLFMASTEGGIKREIEIGFYGYKTSVVTYGGESYIVNAMCEAMLDEDRSPVFKIELVFPELPNSRLLKFTLEGERLVLRMSEAPDQRIVEGYISLLLDGSKAGGFALGLLERKLGEDFIARKLSELFNPSLRGISTEFDGWDKILFNENLLAREISSRGGGMLFGIVSKFLGIGEEAEEKPQGERKSGIFSWFTKRKQTAPAISEETASAVSAEGSDNTAQDGDNAPIGEATE